MTSTAFQNAILRTRRFESATPYLYRDSAAAGNLTCGIGHLVPSFSACALLPFTPPVTQAEWDGLHQLPIGRVASFYASATSGRLSDMYMDAILEQDLMAIEHGLEEDFPGYSQFPDGPAAALLDLSFNLGAHGLQSFIKLCVAVDRRDWETAAAQSHRRGVSAERNREIAGLFQSAVVGAEEESSVEPTA